MVRLRLGTVQDLDLLVRHRRKMFEAFADAKPSELDAIDRAYRRWARARLRSRQLIAFLVEATAGEVLASGALWLMPLAPRPWVTRGRAPYLMSMYTEPKARGRGYATAVTGAAMRWAKGPWVPGRDSSRVASGPPDLRTLGLRAHDGDAPPFGPRQARGKTARSRLAHRPRSRR